MPVDLHISEDQRYLIYEFSEPLAMTELHRAYAQEQAYRDSLAHVVHSIVDMSQLKRIPPNWLTAKAGPGLTHPRSGTMLFVGLSMGLQIVLRTIMNIVRFDRIKFFETREEADAYMAALIAEDRESAV